MEAKRTLRLTERERDTVMHLAEDMGVTQIANLLRVRSATVNQTLARVQRRNGLGSRLALVRAFETWPVLILTPAELRMRANRGG